MTKITEKPIEEAGAEDISEAGAEDISETRDNIKDNITQEKTDAESEAQSEKESYEEKIKELTETLQRLQAEFENFKKRNEKENAGFRMYANREMIAELLPVLDNFELALGILQNEGLRLLYEQLFTTLENHGLKRIETKNKKFDPRLHEALLQEESNDEAGTIIGELQKGYIIGDIVVRPARIKVARRKNETAKISK